MNRHLPHVYVIPEDDSDRQIANGFVLHPGVQQACVRIAAPSRGWQNALRTYQDSYVAMLRKYPSAHVVLLVDFDGKVDKRMNEIVGATSTDDHLGGRVFVLGPRQTPETLRSDLKMPLEEIGARLADACFTGNLEIWRHEQLGHNDAELQRLMTSVKPFLFIRP